MDLEKFLEKKLSIIKRAKWTRHCTYYQPRSSLEFFINNTPVINFCSNDYLGFRYSKMILESMIVAGATYGIGSSGSRLITGSSDLHRRFEESIAAHKEREAALLCSSGYMANLGVIEALMSKDDIIYSDAYNHSSIRSGATISGAHICNYKHLTFLDLERKIRETRHKYKNALLVTDAVFSMDGDSIDSIAIMQLAQQYDLWVLFDEAHSTGLFGEQGQGLIHQQIGNLPTLYNRCIQTITCSKAMGIEGGVILGSHNLISYLQNRQKTFIYSTAPSPMIVGGLIQALSELKNGSHLRQSLWNNTSKLKDFLYTNNFPVIDSQSPILCISAPDNDSVIEAASILQNLGIWIQAIRPPTVPVPRLRLTLNALHTDQHLDILFEALLQCKHLFSLSDH